MKSKAKNTKYHERDRIANNQLKAVFPENWLFKDPRDHDSGKEYSEDWIIEIVNSEGDVTGIEFGLQNKTDVKIATEYANVRMSISDIERIVSLNRPFMLHAYHLPTNISYWIWLQEWYIFNYRDILEKKKRNPKSTILVNIPIRQTLDKSVLPRIIKEA
ncbi:MAG TPA: DUF4365 domain-containing protein, partial [Phototrophicaceae bacterium]|nr:DUF4365 domain-containing protein [Phototrophicaceae bacterium]